MPTTKDTREARGRLIFGDLWEFDPAPETADPKLKPRYDLFIGGKFVRPKTGKYFDSINPGNERKLAEIALAGPSVVDAAYRAAAAAFKGWSVLPGRERGKYLFRIARLLQDRAREFAVAETLDGGKPIKESRDFDVPMAAAHFFYHAGWADKLEYVAPGRTVAPVGVVGQVIPWNFPLLMLAWKLAPALAMGHCVVIKPASNTCITALKLAEIFQDAGLPPGVVNVITGPGSTGGALLAHPATVKIAFTGSTEVGKVIMRSVAGSDKRMTMELGGKAANIVFDDAPIDQAVEGIVNGIFFNQGQVCCAGSRLLVHEPVADPEHPDPRLQFRDHPLGDALLDQEARARAADVALVEEDPVHNPLDRLVDRRVVEHDVGRLAAELHRHLPVGAGELAHDRLADLGRAGEGHLGRARVPHHGGARLPGPGHEVDDPGRQLGVLEDLGEFQRRDGRRLGGLQHDAVAHRERRRELPGEHEEREVPGDDLAHDAQRPGDPPRGHVLQLVRPARVVEEVGGRHRDVEIARLPDRLAAVERLGDRELPRPVLEQPRDPVEVLAALAPRQGGPGLEGVRGGPVRGVDIRRPGERDLGKLRLVRRVDRVEGPPRAGPHEAPSDEEVIAGLELGVGRLRRGIELPQVPEDEPGARSRGGFPC